MVTEDRNQSDGLFGGLAGLFGFDRRRVLLIGVAAAVGLVLAVTLGVVIGRVGSVSQPQMPRVLASLPPPVPSAAATPTPQTTGEDFEQIWKEISAFETFLLKHPNPDLVERIYDPRGPYFEIVHARVAGLVARGHHLRTEGVQVREVRVVRRPNPDEVILRIVSRSGANARVDQSGRVFHAEPADKPIARTLLLRRGQDGRWRMVDLLDVAAP